MKIKPKKQRRKVSVKTSNIDTVDINTLLASILSTFKPTRKEQRIINKIMKERKRSASANFGIYAYLHIV